MMATSNLELFGYAVYHFYFCFYFYLIMFRMLRLLRSF